TRARYKKVIAKTHTAEEFVRARGFDKCVTIPCGYDTARFRTPSVDERSNSRSSWRIDEDSKVLVYAGNLLPRRDVATAIRALAKLRSRGEEAVFLIAGDGPELPKLRSLTRDLGIEESVHFLGQVNWEKLRQAFWAADIFVFPTHYEIFGMVLIEALACGLQIVSTPCPAAKDILSECPNAGRIVPVGDPLALAEACKTLFSRERSSPTSENSTSGYLVRTNWNSISKRIIAEITTSEKI
ncbi:MAG: glycosyltransferase, partial [Candidatus Hodarchaeota archaeon]